MGIGAKPGPLPAVAEDAVKIYAQVQDQPQAKAGSQKQSSPAGIRWQSSKIKSSLSQSWQPGGNQVQQEHWPVSSLSPAPSQGWQTSGIQVQQVGAGLEQSSAVKEVFVTSLCRPPN